MKTNLLDFATRPGRLQKSRFVLSDFLLRAAEDLERLNFALHAFVGRPYRLVWVDREGVRHHRWITSAQAHQPLTDADLIGSISWSCETRGPLSPFESCSLGVFAAIIFVFWPLLLWRGEWSSAVAMAAFWALILVSGWWIQHKSAKAWLSICVFGYLVYLSHFLF